MSDSVVSWLKELSQAVDQGMGWEPDETRSLQLARDGLKTRKLSADIRRERMMGFGFRERVIVRMKVQASDLEPLISNEDDGRGFSLYDGEELYGRAGAWNATQVLGNVFDGTFDLFFEQAG